MMSLRDTTSQIVVVHLSDLHFGPRHRFNPPKAPAGDEPEEPLFPTLLSKLAEDLNDDDPECPVLICLTGDFAESGDVTEFQKAEDFIRGLADTPVLGTPRGKQSIFVVPGNHDVKFDSQEIGFRWQQWTDFYNRTFDTTYRREEPWAFAKVFDRSEDLGAIVACLNSAVYVQKGKEDENRGRLDMKQLTALEEQLEAVSEERLKHSVRIALIHHHPVLIPALAEPGRGYDAVHNSGQLMAILRRYGFHVILHGHKHNPHTFTEDTRPAHQDVVDRPILVAAGGSAGSTSLPPSPRIANCYNRVTVKWHPAGRQARVRIETRGLNTFNPDGTERLPTRWNWSTMRVDDRHFFGFDHTPTPRDYTERPFDRASDQEYEATRCQEYERLRGNLPVVQVLPSLIPGQAYEAVLWIVPHPFGEEKPDRDVPVEVTWCAGPKFEVVTVSREDDPNFTASLAYWGPMLVQARVKFADNYEVLAHVYARMPTSYEAP